MPYDAPLLLELLQQEKFRTLDPTGKVLRPGDPVYVKIAEEMIERGCFIKPTHVYTIIKNDRQGMRRAVEKVFGVKQLSANQSSIRKDSLDKSVEASTEEFQLILSPDTWAKIKPESKDWGEREYMTLKPHVWTNIIADKIWDQTGIPCAFSFKKCRVYKRKDANCYTSIQGKCTECGGKLGGKIFRKPRSKRDVIFHCKIEGRDTTIIHTRKRQLKGYLRKEVGNDLVDGRKTASKWRTDKATEMMEFGDTIPPTLYDTDVLRKAKQQALERRLGLKNTDPIQNLQLAKYDRCLGSIHSIGKDPFYCMYWLEEQMIICKLDKSAGKNTWYMSFDATGGIGKKIKLPNGQKSSHIFLYQLMSVVEGRSTPVFQVVSTRQDAVFIEFFLLEVLRKGAPIPPMVVTDFGSALLVALARAYNSCADLKHYMQVCYDKIVTKSATIKLKCFLRLDVSHFIAMIARWECLRKQVPKARQFYLRTLAHAYKMQDFDKLHAFLSSLLTVALSEDIGRDEMGIRVRSELCLQEATKVIKGTVIDEDLQSVEGDDCNIDDGHTSESWQQWSTSIFDAAKVSAAMSKNGDIANAFYNPEAAEKIRKLMAHLPLWTGVMRQYFKIGCDTATSSSVEAEFADLKVRQFNGCLPMRIDKFIIQHIDCLSGKMRLVYGQTELAKRVEDDAQRLDDSSQIESPYNGVDPKKSTSEVVGESLTDNYCNDNEDHVVECTVRQNVSSDVSRAEAEGIDEPKSMTSINAQLNESEELGLGRCSDTQGNNASDSLDDENPLNFKEGWRGDENQSPAKRKPSPVTTDQPIKRLKKPTYLDDCPDWDSLNVKNSTGLPILVNGLLTSAVTVKGKKVFVRKTCAFDTVFQIEAHALALYDSYRNATVETSNPTIRLAERVLSRGKILQEDYVKRAEVIISLNMFDQIPYLRNFFAIDASSNVAEIAEKVLGGSVPSLRRVKVCSVCDSEISTSLPTISVDIDILLHEGLGFVQNSIDSVLSALANKIVCKTCGTICRLTEMYGPHLLVDTSVLTDENYLASIKVKPRTYQLGSITKQLFVKDNTYELVGVAEYRHDSQHYVAAVTANLNWYEYDDLKKKRSQIEPTTEIIPHLLVYVLK